MRLVPHLAGTAVLLLAYATPAQEAQPRLDADAAARAQQTIDRALDYLRARQDAATGGWAINPDGPVYPAVTALVADAMLRDPALDATDAHVARALTFILSYRQPDGGIYDRVLPSYNTSIALSALSRARTPEVLDAVPDAQRFLEGLQWSEAPLAETPSPELGVGKVSRDQPFYGGVGYGRHGRPDLSNLAFMVEALHDSGYPVESEAYRRAVVFLERVQMDARFNTMPYAAGSRQGGFIYATSENAASPGSGQSMAGTIEETLDDGARVSRLRAYGSMTYAGFKSYLYAGLARDDPRVLAAYGWIRANYTVAGNPGLGTEGYYYYTVVLARALDAWGEPTIDIARPDGTTEPHPWAEELCGHLASLQLDDGSFRVLDDRWLENDPVLITAYAVLAMQCAQGRE